MKDLLLATLLTWVLFIPIAIANGAARDTLYKPKVGDLLAHQISTFIASVLFVALTYLVLGPTASESTTPQLLLAGFVLVALTVLFEFTFGLTRHVPLSRLLADYNLVKGRVWSLFLVVLFFAPYITKVIYAVAEG